MLTGLLLATSQGLIAMRRPGPLMPFDFNAPRDQRLIEAAARGDVDAVRARLEAGDDVNMAAQMPGLAGLQYGATALHYAAEGDHQEIADLLLGRDARTETSDCQGLTPLHWAAGNNCPAMVATLLAAGANSNIRNRLSGQSPLHIAASADVVEALLEAEQIDPNRSDLRGRTPLHNALAPRDWQRTKNPSMGVGLGGPPPAQRMDDMPRAIQLLIEAGANPDARDRTMQLTPLHHAVDNETIYFPQQPALSARELVGVLRALVMAGADMEACGSRHHDTAAPVVCMGEEADRHAWSSCHTPLHLAAKRGHPVAVRTLLALGTQMVPEQKHNVCRH